MNKITFTRVICFISLLPLSLFLTSCDKKNESSHDGNADPNPISNEEKNIHTMLGIDEEPSYDMISITSSQKIYDISTDIISCVVTDENIGKGFYYYEIPFIEFYSDNNKWERLYYNSDRLEHAQWLFCGMNSSSQSTCTLSIEMKRVDFDFVPGNYRFVVFTADNTLYAEFELQ